jgi:hypothetical protein
MHTLKLTISGLLCLYQLWAIVGLNPLIFANSSKKLRSLLSVVYNPVIVLCYKYFPHLSLTAHLPLTYVQTIHCQSILPEIVVA